MGCWPKERTGAEAEDELLEDLRRGLTFELNVPKIGFSVLRASGVGALEVDYEPPLLLAIHVFHPVI